MDWFAVQLREQNVRDRLMNLLRCMFQQVRQSHNQPSVAQPDCRIQACEAAELDL
jgi:hypothetical protein